MEKIYTIQVTRTYFQDTEVKATSAEEAAKEAKELFEEDPCSREDDWKVIDERPL